MCSLAGWYSLPVYHICTTCTHCSTSDNLLYTYLQLQHWPRHPLVHPHEVNSLQALGIGGRDSSSGTNWPSLCIHPISSTGERSGWCGRWGSRLSLHSIFQYMTFASYYLMFKWTHSLLSTPLLAVIVCPSSAVTEWKQPGRYLSTIILILQALGRALSRRMFWIQQRNSSVRSTVCPRLIHATKQEWSCFAKVAHKRLCHQPQMQWSFISWIHTIKRQSRTNLTCHIILIFLQWMKWDGCTRKVS